MSLPLTQPLRRQLLKPVAFLLFGAVVLNALFAAIGASSRSAKAASDRLEQVGRVLAETSFPQSQLILDKLQQLTDADFVVWDLHRHRLVTSTLDDSVNAELTKDLQQWTAAPDVRQRPLMLAGQRYLVSRIESPASSRRQSLWILISERTLAIDRWQAAFPSLLVGGATLLIVLPLLWWLAEGFGRRVGAVQQQLEGVAHGNYGQISETGHQDDEVYRLVRAMNQLSLQLRQLHSRVEQTERARLLGQLAGGLAHQLRNAITGARLAVQLHLRRHSSEERSSLNVALKQLALTEQQLKGLLSLGRQEAIRLGDVTPAELVDEVIELVSVNADHVGVTLKQVGERSLLPIRLDRTGLVAALLNLVQNGIEAAGPRGIVEVETREQEATVSWIVRDSGPGPAPDIVKEMFTPFHSSKREGVGLGLALAQQVANDHQGSLEYQRQDGWTIFCLNVPLRSSSLEIETVPHESHPGH